MLPNTRRTRLFAVGLLVAVLVLLQRQLRLALEAIHAFEARVGLALVPSAVILVVVLLWYLQTRHHEERMRRSVGDTTTSERERRDAVLGGLTRLGFALARASDMGIVRDVVQQALPEFTGTRPFWVVVRAKGKWESIAGGLEESPDRVLAEVERLADQALQRFEGSGGEPEGLEWDGRVYYPLVVGETTSGVLAVESSGDQADNDGTAGRRVPGSAATLVGIAGRNVQLAREVEENGVYDGPTGCFNRTHSMRVLQTELATCPSASGAVCAHHARPRSLQGGQRHLWSAVRRCDPGRGRTAYP